MTALLRLVLVILSLMAVFFVLAATPAGIATTSDSAMYVSAARSLSRGEGLLTCYGTPFVRFPPLYPLLLAIPIADPLTLARWLNALTFGLIVFTSGELFFRSTRSALWTILGAASVLSSWALLISSIYLLTEPLFALLVVAAVLVLPTFLREKSPRSLLILSALAALTPLQRYAGFSVIAAGGVAILLLMRATPLVRRLGYAITFGILSSIPLGLWLVRNLLVSGSVAGGRGEPRTDLSDFGNVVIKWFFPDSNAGILVIIGVLAITAIIFAIILRRDGKITLDALEKIVPLPSGIFLIVITISLLISSQIIYVTLDNRMFAPIFPLLMGVLMTLAANLGRWLDQKFQNRAGTWLIAGLVAAWLLIFPAQKIAREIQLLSQSDAIGFTAADLRESEQVKWLVANPTDEPIFSNWPFPICLNADQYAQLVPATGQVERAIQTLETANQSSLIFVAFETSDSRYAMTYNVEELAAAFEIHPILEAENGAIYRLTRRKNS